MWPVGYTKVTKRNVHFYFPGKGNSKLKCLLILLRNKKITWKNWQNIKIFLRLLELTKRTVINITCTTDILKKTPHNCFNCTCFSHSWNWLVNEAFVKSCDLEAWLKLLLTSSSPGCIPSALSGFVKKISKRRSYSRAENSLYTVFTRV